MPRLAEGPGGRKPVNPGEPAYDELSRIDPEGQGHGRYELTPGPCDAAVAACAARDGAAAAMPC